MRTHDKLQNQGLAIWQPDFSWWTSATSRLHNSFIAMSDEWQTFMGRRVKEDSASVARARRCEDTGSNVFRLHELLAESRRGLLEGICDLHHALRHLGLGYDGRSAGFRTCVAARTGGMKFRLAPASSRLASKAGSDGLHRLRIRDQAVKRGMVLDASAHP